MTSMVYAGPYLGVTGAPSKLWRKSCLDQVMMPGRTKMPSTGHIGDWNAVVRQVTGSLVMKAVMHHRHELKLHSVLVW